MKKFLLTLCVSTPSVKPSLLTVKGIYTALFILILTTTASAQIELKDNTTAVPFHKWEVGVDLKPLFRSDEPYNIVIKRALNKLWSIRMGMGGNNKSTIIGNEAKNSSKSQIGDIYALLLNDVDTEDQNYEFNIGLQANKLIKNIRIYSSIDFFMHKSSSLFSVPFGYATRGSGFPDSITSFIFLTNSSKNLTSYGIRSCFGIQYFLTPHLSISSELSLQFKKESFYSYESYKDFSVINRDVLNDKTVKYTKRGLGLIPLNGLFLNYHF